jgi:hypothetical protein
VLFSTSTTLLLILIVARPFAVRMFSHEDLVFEWIPSEILHSVIGDRCQWNSGPAMILASASGCTERSAGSSLIDSQVQRTRDLAVIFTAYESAS